MQRFATLLFASAALVCAQTPAPKPAAPKAQAAKPASNPFLKKSALDKAALEAYLRHLNLWVPQVSVAIDDPKPSSLPGFLEVGVHLTFNQAFKDEIYLVSKDGQKVIRGTVHDINDSPFRSELSRIKTDLQPSFGEPGAPVVMVVFSDFQCPLCKSEAEIIRQNVAKTFPKDVRVYFRDYPLESIHPWARTAAIAGRCVFRTNPAAFWDYHDWMFANQTVITPDNVRDKILEFAKERKLDALQLGRCVDSKATDKEVTDSIAMGRNLQIDGTPTIFLNGRRLVGSTPWGNLEQIIRMEIEYQKLNPDAGEKCCEVKIPGLK
ncbi:MAG: thioredoxin domain-containing protein [Bryobacteraceae bacterium]|nr:thioredoxin domain-containing protein [Bryobacteraceae bacterium]